MRNLIATAVVFHFALWTSAFAGPYDRNHPYVFYEGNSCSEKRLFSVGSGSQINVCTSRGSRCSGNNDEARSVLIKFNNLPFNRTSTTKYTLKVFDDPNGSRYRDSAKVEIYKRPHGLSTVCLRTFQFLRVYDWGNIHYVKADDGKLDGKISRIQTTHSQ